MKTACGILLILFALTLTNCYKDPSNDPSKDQLVGGTGDSGSFVDRRDYRSYRWVRVSDQVWMAENLSYLPYVNPSSSESAAIPYYYVYDYEGSSVDEAQATENYKAYGVLYNHSAARFDSCPSGWHLPSDEEWKTLEKNLGMSNSDADASSLRSSGSVGGQMKEEGTHHWVSPNSGATNSIGFSARGGGLRNVGGFFGYLGKDAFFWSASSYDAPNAWYRSVTYLRDGVQRDYGTRKTGFSVRCIKD